MNLTDESDHWSELDSWYIAQVTRIVLASQIGIAEVIFQSLGKMGRKYWKFRCINIFAINNYTCLIQGLPILQNFPVLHRKLSFTDLSGTSIFF